MLSNYNYDNKIYPIGDCFGCTTKTCVSKCKNKKCVRQMCGHCWNHVINTTSTCPSCNSKIIESNNYIRNIKNCCAKYIDILYYSLFILCIIIIIILSYVLFKKY